jgi:hypothetical protein
VAVFIELTTDPFDEVRSTQQNIQRDGNDATSIAGRRIARRPLRGLEIKEDRVAAIKVVQSDGTEIPLVDAGSPYGDGQTSSGYTNFVLQNVTEVRMEKQQIVETFGESYIFFFGEAPRFIDVQMIVINSFDFNWEAEWWENYDRFFRGTKLVEMGARLYMFYDDNIVEGYMLSSQGTKVSDQPFIVQMTFRMFLTGHRNITFVGDPQYPIRASVVLPDNINLRDPNATGALFAALRGAALNDAKAQGFGEEVSPRTLRQIGGLNTASSLSNFLRAAPNTVALPVDLVSRIESLGLNPLDEIRDNSIALRGNIADNRDEYLGVADEMASSPNFQQGTLGVPPGQAPTVRSQQEVEDLWLESIYRMGLLGVDINNPRVMSQMGLMPLFGGRSTSGMGGGTAYGGAFGASFTPRSGASYGTPLTSTALSPNPAYDQRTQAPLGAVFGGGSAAQINTRSTMQGAGDRDYGYPSDFATRPGFGQPGYGDYGGNGFGTGLGETGDPGFVDPSLFTFDGVSDNPAAFNRFNRPRRNNTVFGVSLTTDTRGRRGGRPGGRIGLGDSNSGLSGGGAYRVPGRPSCFSIVSAGGSLNFVEVDAIL